MTEKWILRVVENVGETTGKDGDDHVAVPAGLLREDMQQHLSFKPKNYSWTIGWRTYVWQEKETGKFQELTEDEWAELSSVGTLSYTRDDSGSDDASASTTRDEGSDTE